MLPITQVETWSPWSPVNHENHVPTELFTLLDFGFALICCNYALVPFPEIRMVFVVVVWFSFFVLLVFELAV